MKFLELYLNISHSIRWARTKVHVGPDRPIKKVKDRCEQTCTMRKRGTGDRCSIIIARVQLDRMRCTCALKTHQT